MLPSCTPKTTASPADAPVTVMFESVLLYADVLPKSNVALPASPAKIVCLTADGEKNKLVPSYCIAPASAVVKFVPISS